MRRIDLAAITLESWGRLDDRQRQRFAEMFLRAALRLGGPELRRWLRRRVRTAPLAPTDAIRTMHPSKPMVTFWDYKRNRWPRDAGHLPLSIERIARQTRLQHL